jgi:hypothetical protein
MAMDAAGDAVMDLSRALDTIQKHGRRRKLETEVATHLREAEKRLRCCVALSSSESIAVLFLYSAAECRFPITGPAHLRIKMTSTSRRLPHTEC